MNINVTDGYILLRTVTSSVRRERRIEAQTMYVIGDGKSQNQFNKTPATVVVHANTIKKQ